MSAERRNSGLVSMAAMVMAALSLAVAIWLTSILLLDVLHLFTNLFNRQFEFNAGIREFF